MFILAPALLGGGPIDRLAPHEAMWLASQQADRYFRTVEGIELSRISKEAIMAQPSEDFAPTDHLTPEERNPEAPADDAFEQATVADPSQDEPTPRVGLEVDDYDSVEQSRVVGLDEDDYR